MKKIIFYLLLGVSVSLNGQSINLGFETLSKNNLPNGWYCGGDGYSISVDSIEKTEGLYSMKIECLSKKENAFGVASAIFPIEPVRGKHIIYKGKIKTQALQNGFAGLWWRVDGKGGEILGFDNMSNLEINGDQDWQDVCIEMTVDSSGQMVVFGTLHTGEGTAWFDDLEVWIDGEEYNDPVVLINPLNQEEIAWLKSHMYPLRSFNPNDPDHSDLKILDSLTNNCKILALGEVSHGSKEIFMMKHRIIQYMAEKNEFDIFSIEANMPEAYRLNQYVMAGRGNPVELIKGMYFWTWSTKEVLNLVNWMKEYNRNHQKRMHFTGFDMQFFKGSIKELNQLFGNDKAGLKNLADLEKELDTIFKESIEKKGDITLTDQQKTKTTQLILTLKEKVKKLKAGGSTKKWAEQNVRIIEQYFEMSSISRDQCMAENLLWIKNQDPKSKIIAWGHNGHIRKTEGAMGSFLHDSIGDEYLTIGFTFHKGNYTAAGKNGLAAYDAQESYLGTYEYFFNAIDEPIFLLDLRQAKKEKNPAAQWLLNKMEFRQTGALQMDQEFYPTQLTDDFDFIIFIKESTHSDLLD